MTPASYHSSGSVRISGNKTLSETAALLGEVFGLNFESIGQAGVERPAWVGKRGGLRYIVRLTDDAEQGLQLGDTREFELSVQSTNSANGTKPLEIADFLVNRIRRDGRLECWPNHRTKLATK